MKTYTVQDHIHIIRSKVYILYMNIYYGSYHTYVEGGQEVEEDLGIRVLVEGNQIIITLTI